MVKEEKLPLCIDLDGTLIRSDVTQESVLLFIRKYPLKILNILIWLMRGRAFLKSRLADHILINPALLPYNDGFLNYIKDKATKGFDLYLVTAADQKYAKIVYDYLGIFKEYLASDGRKNLRASNKADALCARFGANHFIYAGNSRHDLPVWEKSAEIIAVNTPQRVIKKCIYFQKKIHKFEDEFLSIKDILKEIISYTFLKYFLLLAGIFILGNTIFYWKHIVFFEIGQSLLIVFSLFFLNLAAILLGKLFRLNEIRMNPLTKKSLLSTSRLTIIKSLYLIIIFITIGIILGKNLSYFYAIFLISFFIFQFIKAIKN